MTTIAWDGVTLAADKRATVQDTFVTAPPKIRLLANGTLIGASGANVKCLALIAWVENGGERPAILADEDWCPAIEITPDAKILFHGQYGRSQIIAPFFAIGSGGHFAMGAMAHGATAINAVLIASQLDPFSGNGIDALTLGDA